MNKNDDLLDFLIEELNGPQRDLVTRAFYKFAEGDPESGPVNEAILLTACSRRLAQAPKELREAVSEFKKLLAEGRVMEVRLQQRMESSQAGVITTLRDEAARAASQFQTTAQSNEAIVAAARQMTGIMQHFVSQGGSLLTELQTLKTQLKTQDESTRRIAEATRNNLYISESTKELVTSLIHMIGINRITIGFVIGVTLTSVASQLHWWMATLLFAISVGLLTWLGHSTWKAVSEGVSVIK